MRLAQGTVHKIQADLRRSLTSDTTALRLWSNITPLARNEWICWVESAKLPETRARRIAQTNTKLASGMRRPCCWQGCCHRERTGR